MPNYPDGPGRVDRVLKLVVSILDSGTLIIREDPLCDYQRLHEGFWCSRMDLWHFGPPSKTGAWLLVCDHGWIKLTCNR